MAENNAIDMLQDGQGNLDQLSIKDGVIHLGEVGRLLEGRDTYAGCGRMNRRRMDVTICTIYILDVF